MQSQTHANTLPDEMICKIMSTVVAAELQNDKVAKFDLENRALERIQCLKSVCRRWNSALQHSTKHVLKDVLRLLSRVGVRPVFFMRKKFSFGAYVTTLLDKVFIIYNSNSYGKPNTVHLDVYRLEGQNLEYEDSTELAKLAYVECCAACHGCIYVIDSQCIWKITPEDLQPMKWLKEDRMHNGYAFNAKISVSHDGNLMLVLFSSVGIYGPDGNILENIILPMERYPCHVGRKSNRNTVVYHSFLGGPNSFDILYEYKAEANNDFLNVWLRLTFDEDVRTIWDNKNSDMITKVGHNYRTYEEKTDKMREKFELDSSDNVITTDQEGKQLIVFDSLFRCHRFPLEDPEFETGLCDVHYDEKSNILFLMYNDDSNTLSSSDDEDYDNMMDILKKLAGSSSARYSEIT